MDAFRSEVKDQVVRANRGPFGGWWEALLKADPELLRRVHVHLESAEQAGPISGMLRHLIWTAVDAVVTHLYPRGLGVHARIAVELGASVRQVMEVLSIATVVSSRGFGFGLSILLEQMDEAGLPALPKSNEVTVRKAIARLESQLEEWPDWMTTEASSNPEALHAFLDLGYGRPEGEGLDEKSRELIFVAAASCPAIVDPEMTRRHIRRALAAGATPEELLQALRLANGIGLHPISEGVMQLQEHGLVQAGNS